MTYTVGVEVRRYATVTVDAATEEEAFEQACQKAIEDSDQVDWNNSVVDTCEVISAIENFCEAYDRDFEERREEKIA